MRPGAAMAAPGILSRRLMHPVVIRQPRFRAGPLEKRERALAYNLLLPTFTLVLAIVLFPLLANFWISVKPVELADLRPPRLMVTERLRGKLQEAGDQARLEYRYRNSSQKYPLLDAGFSDDIPEGLRITLDDDRCRIEANRLHCTLGWLEKKTSERLRLKVTAEAAWIANPVRPKDSKPEVRSEADNVLTDSTFTLENFARLFSASEFVQVLLATIYYTVFGTAGALVAGLFAAQLLNTSFRGRNVLRGLFLFPYVAPVIAVAFTWVILLDPFSGTVNTLLQEMEAVDKPLNFFGQRSMTFEVAGLALEFPLALTMVILFEVWRYFPLSFLFILARMQAIPADILEAAEMDGATPLQQFWHISLPQIVGILAVLFLLRFIWTFNKFDDIFLLTGGNAGTRTLTVDVYEQAFAISNLGAGAAVAVVVFVVLLSFSLLFFRFAPKDE